MKRFGTHGRPGLSRLALGLLPLAAALCLAACERQEEQVRLTSRERIQVDSISNRQIDSLRSVLDSVCIAIYPRLLQEKLDSLIVVRREEEAKLRARILRQQQQLQERQQQQQ